jgi:hypothetical protein
VRGPVAGRHGHLGRVLERPGLPRIVDGVVLKDVPCFEGASFEDPPTENLLGVLFVVAVEDVPVAADEDERDRVLRDVARERRLPLNGVAVAIENELTCVGCLEQRGGRRLDLNDVTRLG